MPEWLTILFESVMVFVVGPSLVYLSHKARQIHAKLKQHDRILYGEGTMDRWDGIIGEVYTVKDRQKVVIDNQNRIINALEAQDIVEPQHLDQVRHVAETPTDVRQ